LGLLLLAFFQVGKPQLGNRDVIGFKTSANELALHAESGKIDPAMACNGLSLYMQSFANRTQNLSLRASAVVSCGQYQIVKPVSKTIIFLR
jgi:hypothetical protein